MNLKEESVMGIIGKVATLSPLSPLCLKKAKALSDYTGKNGAPCFVKGEKYVLWFIRAYCESESGCRLSTFIVLPEGPEEAYEIPDAVFGRFEKAFCIKEANFGGVDYSLIWDYRCKRVLIPSWRLDKKAVMDYISRKFDLISPLSCQVVGKVFAFRNGYIFAAMICTLSRPEGANNSFIFNIEDEANEFPSGAELAGSVIITRGHSFNWFGRVVKCDKTGRYIMIERSKP